MLKKRGGDVERRRYHLGFTLVLSLLLGSLATGVGLAGPGITTRISIDNVGTEGDNWSYNPSISADGRYVAFESYSTNLVPGDTNGVWDVFVHDRYTGQITRVSVDNTGNQGDLNSEEASISADGRYVAFSSAATNLVPGDTNNSDDVFVHDRQTGQTTRVSVDNTGNQGDRWSVNPSISADGRYVAFSSYATNLVAADTNDWEDIFVHDRQTAQTTRVSVDSAGNQGDIYSYVPSISANGRYVVFTSDATNLILGDTNNVPDIFVHDRQTAQTTRVSVDNTGNPGNGTSYLASISADGRYVAFDSDTTSLVAGDTNGVTDVFVRRMPTNVAPNDYDGDGKTDFAVWRQDTGYWYIVRSSDNVVVPQQWGLASVSDVPVSGDFDGDGQTDIGVWRKNTGYWYVLRSSDSVVVSQQWGLGSASDVPVPGDYDGDGKTDFAVWRQDTGNWYVLRSSDGGVTIRQWGLASVSDVPVPGR